MNANEFLPSRYLKAGDIGDEGAIFTIRDVKQELIGSGADQSKKPCLRFIETHKLLVLNKTNLNQSESTASGGETPTGSAVPGVDLRRPPSRKAPRDMRTAMSGGSESIPREMDPPGCGMRERPEPAAPR